MHVRICIDSIFFCRCSEPLLAIDDMQHSSVAPLPINYSTSDLVALCLDRVPCRTWQSAVCGILWLPDNATVNVPAHGWPMSHLASCSAGHASQPDYVRIPA